MSNFPADIMNESLDAAGVDFTIGEPNEGTHPAQVALRKYGQCLRQLLRAAHWDYARSQQPLVMLADATGQTDGVGTVTIAPWVYTYSYPTNCMKARFLPANYLNPNASAVPQTSVSDSQPPYGYGMRLIPAPFLISMDSNYPIDPNSNWMDVQGVSPTSRVVILSNVNQAQLVFTAFQPYPTMWDAQFRAAMVAYLAAEIALPLSKDKKFGLAMRDRNILIAKERINAARVTNGNESGFPQTTDHLPDWMQTRFTGGGGNGLNYNGCGGEWGGNGYGWNGSGFLGYGWDSSVF